MLGLGTPLAVSAVGRRGSVPDGRGCLPVGPVDPGRLADTRRHQGQGTALARSMLRASPPIAGRGRQLPSARASLARLITGASGATRSPETGSSS